MDEIEIYKMECKLAKYYFSKVFNFFEGTYFRIWD